MLERLASLAAVAILAIPALALAQEDTGRYVHGASLAPDLKFPTTPSRLGLFSSPEMAVYKPEGTGPFPALVLVHSCGGLVGTGKPNTSILGWAKVAVGRGYVALVIDSLQSRGADSLCFGPQKNVNFARGAKDALQAVAHLRTLPYVDGRRIAVVGFSWGAMVATFQSSASLAEALLPGARPAAAVAFYPGCGTIRPATGPPFELVRNDIDRPLLVLMGGQDNETPPSECLARLEPMRKTRPGIELHVYPDATHCWECDHLNGLVKTDSRGNTVYYRYDRAATEDSERRMFEFLERSLPRP